jgi:hypothetical protein
MHAASDLIVSLVRVPTPSERLLQQYLPETDFDVGFAEWPICGRNEWDRFRLGLCTTMKDKVNADLLNFIKG